MIHNLILIYMKRLFSLLSLIMIALPVVPELVAVDARQAPVVEIRFTGHHFEPARLTVPAGIPFAIKVINQDRERIEFESFKLHREKVVEPGQDILVRIPALGPGSYDFFDDFHDDVAEGTITAR